MKINNNMIAFIKENYSIKRLVSEMGIEINSGNFIRSIYSKDKTPSLKLYPAENRYHCFSTNRSGDVIQFYMDITKTDFPESVKALHDKLFAPHQNSTTPSLIYSGESKRENLIKVLDEEEYYFHERAGTMEFVGGLSRSEAEERAIVEMNNMRRRICEEIYSELYKNSPLTPEVLDYLTSSNRKLNAETIEKFKLFSFSEQTYEFLQENYTDYQLTVSGLINDGLFFTFSKHRLIIPYVENGKIVYLRARYFDGENNPVPPRRTPKYLSLSNNLGNLPGKRFYNVDTLLDYSGTHILVTEGEFDTMIAEQQGFKAVGIPGVSGFPKDGAKILEGYTPILALDADDAGQKAIAKIRGEFEGPVYILGIKNGKDLTEAA